MALRHATLASSPFLRGLGSSIVTSESVGPSRGLPGLAGLTWRALSAEAAAAAHAAASSASPEASTSTHALCADTAHSPSLDGMLAHALEAAQGEAAASVAVTAADRTAAAAAAVASEPSSSGGRLAAFDGLLQVLEQQRVGGGERYTGSKLPPAIQVGGWRGGSIEAAAHGRRAGTSHTSCTSCRCQPHKADPPFHHSTPRRSTTTSA